MRHIKRSRILILLILAVFLLVACGADEEPEKVEPARVEEIEGSEFNRVILTEKAAERLGIETAPINEGEMSETQEVMHEGQVTDAGEGLVRVSLDKNTWSKVDAAQPVHVLLRADDDGDEDEGILAEMFEPEDADEVGDDDEGETHFFKVGSGQQDLTDGQAVFVKLSLSESGSKGLVIPYSAVVYGLHGETWTYTNPEPLTYIRHPITVDHIEGGQAFLSDGPPAGTSVVTVGAQMLYGADTGVGK
jgi:hypothetical protein